jgi:hypothetical protein
LQVAACISRSMGYVGSSMHGFITASAFKKPAVIVAAKSMNKFTGLLESIEGPQLLHQSWINALEHFSDIILSGQQQFLSNSSKTALDKHWSTIADLFSKEASTRSFPDGRNEKKLRSPAKPRSVRFKESILELRAKELLGQQRKASQKIAELQAGRDEDHASYLQNFQKMEHLIADQKSQLEELQILRNNEIINSSKQISELKTLIVNTESSMRATQQAYAAEQSKSTMRIRHLETELHIKRQKIDDMLASTSWRITSPIRKVKSLWNKPPSK